MQTFFQQMIVIVLGILLCYGGYRFIKARQLFGEVEMLKEESTRTQAALEKALREIYSKNSELDSLNSEIEVAKEKASNARHLAEQELELEEIKRRDKYEKELQEQFQKLRESSDLAAFEKELAALQSSIQEAKTTLNTLQHQQQQELERESFVETHSIHLEPDDENDIILIKEFANKLNHKGAIAKLIWTEFYQKPLQWLTKNLGADKTMGIYKVTECSSGRMYIGQAVDIGTRWKEHVKAALGVEGTVARNKFYRTMSKVGPENFTFEILEQCERPQLNEREAYWIEFYNATSYGFNSKAM